MKTCPQCRDEYRDSVTTCPDCQVELSSGPSADQGDERLAPIPVEFASTELRDGVCSLLTEAGIPFRDTPDGGCEVPAGLATGIVAFLAQSFEIDWTEASLKVLGGTPAAAPLDPSILQWSDAELEEDPTAAIDGLRRLVEQGEPAVRQQAVRKLDRMVRAERATWGELLLAALDDESEAEVFAYCAQLVESGATGDLALRIVERVPRGDRPLRLLALHALSRLPDARVAQHVVELLEEEDVEVRDAADEVLCCISGRDVGFDADADPAARASAVAAWRDWISTQT